MCNEASEVDKPYPPSSSRIKDVSLEPNKRSTKCWKALQKICVVELGN